MNGSSLLVATALALPGAGLALAGGGVGGAVGVALFAGAAVYTVLGVAAILPRVLAPAMSHERDPAGTFLERALGLESIDAVAREFDAAVRGHLRARRGFLVAPSETGVHCVGGGPAGEIADADEAFVWLGERTEAVTRDELRALTEFPGARATLALMELLAAEIVLPLRHRGVLLGLGVIAEPHAMPSQEPGFYKAMRAYATAAVANTYLGAETRHGSTLARTLDLATAMQESLMPDERAVRRSGYELRGVFRPVAECGGDLWSWRELGPGRVLLVIADATGHGAAPALLAAAAKGAIDAHWQLMGEDLDPAALLSALNRAVHRAGKTRYFMTGFAAVVDARRGELRYANAAQNFPFFLTGDASGGRLEALVARGNTLGAAAEAHYETHVRPMAPGQKLVLYTDGIVNAEGRGVGPYGEKRLRAALTRLAPERATRIPGLLIDEVLAFTGGAELADDITLAAVGLAVDDEPA